MFVYVSFFSLWLLFWNYFLIVADRGAKLFVLLTQYYAGDKIEKNELGWACGAYG